MESVLKMRAERLARPRGDAAVRPQGMAVLCFTVAAETYALPLSALAEVLPLSKWTPVPGMAQQLLGVTNRRGEIQPVLDLHVMLGLPPPDAEAPAYVVFLRAAEVAVRVEALENIAFIDPQALTLPHLSANGLPQRFLSGITPDTVILLDPQQILALDVLTDRRGRQ